MVNDSVSKEPVYFTCKVGGGFTSQLIEFLTFYKLGRSLGYRYVHTPFANKRSSPRVHDFLGVDSY